MIETKEISKERLTYILCTSRAKAGVTQEAMAMELGVARKTIQNWEKGVTYPDLIQTVQWFEVLNVNPMSFLFQYRYPGMFGMKDEQHNDLVRETLHSLIDLLPEESLSQLLYIYYGDHGSDPRGLINLLNAYLQTPLKSRVTMATAILKSYELAKGTDSLTSEKGLQPNVDFLKHCIRICQEAVFDNKVTYEVNYDSEM